MTPQSHDAGWRPLLDNGNWLRALVIAGGTGLHAVSIYVVVTIMPVVVGDIGGLPFFAWTATLYVAASLASSAAVPLMLSRAGPRPVYRLACLIFATGSLVCALATSMPMLLIGRVLQGIGGGMLPALGYALVRVIFPPSLHARAIVLVGSVWGIAALAGPAIGGVFAQFATWRWAFGIDIILGGAFVLLAGPVLPTEPTATARPFPGIRLALLVLAALAVSAGGATSAALPAAAGTIAAIALILLTLRLDASATPRMLPAGAFNLRTPLGAVSATMFLLIMTASPNTFIPYILRSADGVAPLVGGYVNATYALSWTFISLVTAAALHAHAMMRLGPILMLAGIVLIAVVLPLGNLALVFAGQILLGCGIGVGWAHLGALLMQVASPADRDLAGPFITTTQTLATVFGSALAGMIANLAGLPAATTPAALGHTAAWLFAISALVPAGACLTSWRMLALTREAKS